MKSLICQNCDIELIDVHILKETNDVTDMTLHCPYCLTSSSQKIRGKFALSNKPDHYYEIKENHIYVIHL